MNEREVQKAREQALLIGLLVLFTACIMATLGVSGQSRPMWTQNREGPSEERGDRANRHWYATVDCGICAESNRGLWRCYENDLSIWHPGDLGLSSEAFQQLKDTCPQGSELCPISDVLGIAQPDCEPFKVRMWIPPAAFGPWN